MPWNVPGVLVWGRAGPCARLCVRIIGFLGLRVLHELRVCGLRLQDHLAGRGQEGVDDLSEGDTDACRAYRAMKAWA